MKDLLRAITLSKNLTLPLPDDLERVIDAYNTKHSPPEETEADRLQEELLNIYEKYISDQPARLAPFLCILRNLKPVLQGTHRSLQWWDKLSTPMMSHLGAEKRLADVVTETMLEVLLYDEDVEESRIREAQDVSDNVAGSLLSIWLENTTIAEEEFGQHAIAVAKQVQLILTEFGKKKPKARLSSSLSMCFILIAFAEFPRVAQQDLYQEREQNISPGSTVRVLPPPTTTSSRAYANTPL